MDARPNIVLVHGAWADGSCWSDVVERLQVSHPGEVAQLIRAAVEGARCADD